MIRSAMRYSPAFLMIVSFFAAESTVLSQAAPDNLRIIAVELDRDAAAAIQPHIDAGKRKIEQFFGRTFPKPFQVEVFPDRAKFDEYFERRWKVPKTELWMVASGVADRMVLLSPRVWKTEAREHNPADTDHVRDLIAHELVHVFHGQHCPKPDFAGMDDMGWFVEGLAVYVSGQLERAHRRAAREALQAGKGPARLADAWSGRYRYGVSGSIVEFIDHRYGREAIRKMLSAVSNDEALKSLGTSESELIRVWIAAETGRRND